MTAANVEQAKADLVEVCIVAAHFDASLNPNIRAAVIHLVEAQQEVLSG